MQQQPEMSSVQQWHISFHAMMDQDLYTHILFQILLVGQMEATLEGEDVNVRIRSNKLKNKIITWPDSLADDYIHCPIEYELDQICFYK